MHHCYELLLEYAAYYGFIEAILFVPKHFHCSSSICFEALIVTQIYLFRDNRNKTALFVPSLYYVVFILLRFNTFGIVKAMKCNAMKVNEHKYEF